MKIINDEFVKQHPKAAKNGDILIFNWIIPHSTYAYIITQINKQFNTSITISNDDIDTIIKGPIGNIRKYPQMKINDVVFVSNEHERGVSRVTRKYCYVRMPLDHNDDDQDSNGKRTKHAWNDVGVERETNRIVARIDAIYSVQSHNMLLLAKAYKLIRITNYKYLQEHESTLPHVTIMSNAANITSGIPVVEAMEILPVNIGLWPSSLHQHTNLLVVHTNPAFGD